MNLQKMIPPVLRFSSQMSPELSVGWLVKFFCYPGPKRKSRIDRFPRGFNFRPMEFENKSIATWSWENQGARRGRVILAHGWGGFSYQMIKIVEPLLAAGFSVTAYDQPAHGHSQGTLTTLPEWSRLVRQLFQEFPDTRAMVAHSFGGLAVGYELAQGLDLSAFVTIGAPTSPSRMVDRFVQHFKLKSSMEKLMKLYINQKENIEFDDFELNHFGPDVHTPSLIIHDVQDSFVDVASAQEWKRSLRDSQVLITEGLGHHQVLKEQKVHDSIVQFLNIHLRGQA